MYAQPGHLVFEIVYLLCCLAMAESEQRRKPKARAPILALRHCTYLIRLRLCLTFHDSSFLETIHFNFAISVEDSSE